MFSVSALKRELGLYQEAIFPLCGEHHFYFVLPHTLAYLLSSESADENYRFL